MDLHDVAEYSSSDDIRHINWKATAKSGQPSVNTYNESRQLPIVLVYLNSGGLYFGEYRSKKSVAVEVLTALSAATILGDDSLSTLFYSDNSNQWYHPSRQKSAIYRSYTIADELDPLGCSVDFVQLSATLMKYVNKKSLIFLIGDFWGVGDVQELSELAHFHELYCIIIRDKSEEHLDLRGSYAITDPNTRQSQQLHINSRSASRYNDMVAKHNAMLDTGLETLRVENCKIYTHDDAIVKLAEMMR